MDEFLHEQFDVLREAQRAYLDELDPVLNIPEPSMATLLQLASLTKQHVDFAEGLILELLDGEATDEGLDEAERLKEFFADAADWIDLRLHQLQGHPSPRAH